MTGNFKCHLVVIKRRIKMKSISMYQKCQKQWNVFLREISKFTGGGWETSNAIYAINRCIKFTRTSIKGVAIRRGKNEWRFFIRLNILKGEGQETSNAF